MDYNTSRNKLIIPEYGRNIQKMIEYALTIEDREKRTKTAHLIVGVMGQIHPLQKEVGDFKHKLWDHLHMISRFKMDVDSPYPPPPENVLVEKPEQITHYSSKIKYRYYGRNVELIVEKAIAFEEGPEKEALIKTLANHLKKSYVVWNRDSITDETIQEHIDILSKGKLVLGKDVQLESVVDIMAKNQKKKKPTAKQNSSYSKPKRKYK
ncbi:MAG: DUF4290 domain-containing protein [Saprospiraceae bacterium]|nr:DUF4290 domain-containing protein [Saprospiraceae bacterium]